MGVGLNPSSERRGSGAGGVWAVSSCYGWRGGGPEAIKPTHYPVIAEVLGLGFWLGCFSGAWWWVVGEQAIVLTVHYGSALAH